MSASTFPHFDGESYVCGAFQPDPPPRMEPYRCTRPYCHIGDHQAVIDGEVVAQWLRRNP